MRIVNIKRFRRLIGLIIGIIFIIIFLNSNNSYSKEEIKTKKLYISNGDTLWSIASNEQENNSYYQGKDIRQIIYEIKELNNIEDNCNLIVGQQLEIKTL